MSTVYITQIPARLDLGRWVPTVDVNPAKEFGEIKVLMPSGMNLHAIEGDAETAILEMRDEFNPLRDFFLPMGDPLLMVAASAALAGKVHGFKMLKWDRYERKYFTYDVSSFWDDQKQFFRKEK